MTELTQTIETRLPRDVVEKFDSVLSEYAAHYSRCLRVFVARKNRGESVSKKLFSSEFGLTARQFNSIRTEVDALFQSQKSNYERYILEAEKKNAIRLARVELLNFKIANAHLIDDDAKRSDALFKLHNELAGCRNGIDRAKVKILKWSDLIKSKKISICFGSRDLMRKHNHLEDNHYANHDEWLAGFRTNRDSEIFLLGAKDEADGNQSCTISKSSGGLYNIRLRLPNCFKDKYGTHILFENIPFNYRQEKLSEIIEANDVRKSLKKNWETNGDLQRRHQSNLDIMIARQETILARMVERGDDLKSLGKVKENYLKSRNRFASYTENNALCDFGRPLSCRLKRDSKGWRVILSISYEVERPQVTNRKKGAIGVDLNAHHLAVAEMDRFGKKVQVFDLNFRDGLYGDTSNQVKAGLGNAISKLTQLAVETGKPIVIENLDFKDKKSTLRSGKQKQYNKMVSSLVTQRFLNILKLRCAEKGIELLQVNAAYTSFIGRLKYANEVRFNIHQAAAMVIARRGVGFSDRHLPRLAVCFVRKELMYFPTPKDDGKGDAFSYLRKVRTAYTKWNEQMKLLSSRSQRSVEQPDFCAEIPF
ncbi:IS200/IS605 family accessory protein TnpB-related protein [Vibrio barjaei]|uniref:IS200/IS605 family accessory protein TnpB-related protein n=1 Tax=Vibrio barjaei TaxID=1676683 RepID=UPI0022851961|nr:IS200/IS605 family accessory protein TnpB-related protein [Vibrio barjaei]MCY9870405.1 IS200/IS605 family accessory protein TnpB-related protein [Vibrio barjaei]